MVSHRVTSGMLFGIENGANGFSNNAEELKNASIYFNNKVIMPFQEILTDAFDRILEFNNMSLDLFFVSNQPKEWEDENQNQGEDNNETNQINN